MPWTRAADACHGAVRVRDVVREGRVTDRAGGVGQEFDVRIIVAMGRVL